MEALAVAAVVMSATGAIQQGNAAAAQYKAQAQANEFNATVSRQQAQTALNESSAAQIAQQRKSAQVLGMQRAASAQAGVGDGGTTADLLDRSQTLSELDQLNLAYEGTMKARGFNTQADLDTYYGQVNRANAKQARRAGYMKAATSVLTFGMNQGGGATQAPAPVETRLTPYAGSGLTTGGGVGLRSGGGQGLRYG